MCGICGLVTRVPLEVEPCLREMNAALVKRGPDDEGYLIRNNMGIAMRRLSIIDLQTGKQPIFSANRRFAIVFNGEIYNYRQLRSEHLHDFRFETQSDTEVVVNMYQRFGSGCLSYLRGIFAFAIADLEENTLFIARDHLGVKPLHYYASNGGVWFSSDIRSFRNIPQINLSINHQVIPTFLQLGYIPSPNSIYHNVFKLPPGSYMEVDSNSNYKIKQYYSITDNVRYDLDDSFSVATQRVRQLVTESVTEQLVSDVPLGAFLSGGVDSSIITYEMANRIGEGVNTFTIGFGGSTNRTDVELSRLLSSHLGTNHFEEIVEPNIDETIHTLVSHMGEPLGITSAIPIYINSQIARKKVKVVLSGDGADELFGGYRRYSLFGDYHKLQWLRALPVKQFNWLLSGLVGLINSRKITKGYRIRVQTLLNFLQNRDAFDAYHSLIGINNPCTISKLFPFTNSLEYTSPERQKFEYVIGKKGLTANSLMLFDCHASLVDEMLAKVDFSSMLASLEVRVPFLDHRIAEYALSLPVNYKVYTMQHKRVLKDAYRNALPGTILSAPKRGFNLPLDGWIKNNWATAYSEVFRSESLKQLGFNTTELSDLFRRYKNGMPVNGKLFYYIFILHKWHSHNRLGGGL